MNSSSNYPTTQLSRDEAADLIMLALRRGFPDVEFRHSWAADPVDGETVLEVRWTDGPPQREVQEIASFFQGAGIHCDYPTGEPALFHFRHWLSVDGSLRIADTHRDGRVERTIWANPPEESAELVQLSVGFVYCERDVSPELRARVVDRIERETGLPFDPIVVYPTYGVHGSELFWKLVAETTASPRPMRWALASFSPSDEVRFTTEELLPTEGDARGAADEANDEERTRAGMLRGNTNDVSRVFVAVQTPDLYAPVDSDVGKLA